MDVVEAADVIFCCVSDPKGAKDVSHKRFHLYIYLIWEMPKTQRC